MASIIVPSDENGLILDPAVNNIISQAVNVQPFGFEDVIVFSHGWSTNADSAMDDYAIFSIGLARTMLLAGTATPGILPSPPRSSLDIGIHWPSEITEDSSSPLTALQLFTFYKMEHRADAVGKNLVYSVLRIALQARQTSGPVRFLLLGHSFGCKVICSALQDLAIDILDNSLTVPDGSTWRVVLLEPATDYDNLEPNDIYGSLREIASLRLLITTSQEDRALSQWYLDAARIANLFHAQDPTPALGAVGPSKDTVAAFGGVDAIAVNTDFTIPMITATTHQLVIADLTPVHQARLACVPPSYAGGLSGSHSDIYFEQIYNLVGGFLFS